MEQAIVFAAGTTRYALRLADLEQVLAHSILRPLPMAPHGVVGLLPWRGQLLVTIDLKLLTMAVATAPRFGTRVMVVRWAGGEPVRYFALLCERVIDVLALSQVLGTVRTVRTPFLGQFVEAEGQPQLVLPQVLLADVVQQVDVGSIGMEPCR